MACLCSKDDPGRHVDSGWGIEREDGGHAGDRRGDPDQGKGEQFTHLFRR